MALLPQIQIPQAAPQLAPNPAVTAAAAAAAAAVQMPGAGVTSPMSLLTPEERMRQAQAWVLQQQARAQRSSRPSACPSFVAFLHSSFGILSNPIPILAPLRISPFPLLAHSSQPVPYTPHPKTDRMPPLPTLPSAQQVAGLAPRPPAANKKNREVYVGNLAVGVVTADLLTTFFNTALRAAFPQVAGDPVMAVQQAMDGKYAFVELRTGARGQMRCGGGSAPRSAQALSAACAVRTVTYSGALFAR